VTAVVAIEHSTLAQFAKEIGRAHVQLQDADRMVEAAEQKTESARQEQARRRLELGRLLIDAKRACKHGDWLPYLAKLGIEPRSAQNWMAIAGFMEAKSETQPSVSYLPDAPPSPTPASTSARVSATPSARSPSRRCLEATTWRGR
jgi:hypothetical protein